MYTFEIPRKNGDNCTDQFRRESIPLIARNIEFTDAVQTNDRSKFRRIKRTKIQAHIAKPRNKFIICKNMVNKLIYKYSSSTELDQVSHIASLIWHGRSREYDRYLKYLALLEIEHYRLTYNYFARDIQREGCNQQKASSKIPSKLKKAPIKKKCLFKNYLVHNGKPHLFKPNVKAKLRVLKTTKETPRIEDVYFK